MSLKQKIHDLFALRRLPYLLTFIGDKDHADLLLKKLVDLQESIYHLDAVLEEGWTIDSNRLHEKWAIICQELASFGLTKNEIKNQVKEIELYQSHELSLREGDHILQLPMDYFYYYKSCDVKLLRRLIYKSAPSLVSSYPIDDWKHFDLITELHDDVEDVFEDEQTVNGNRFLLEIKELGISAAVDHFKSFSEEVIFEARQTLKGKVLQITEDAYTAFRNLLVIRKAELLKTQVTVDEKVL